MDVDTLEEAVDVGILEHHQLEQLAEATGLRTLAPGEVLFEEGDQSDAVYLITSGEIDFTQRGTHTAFRMVGSPGEFVGEMGVIANQPRSATARARGEVQILSFTREGFEELLVTTPFLVWKLIRTISARLRRQEIDSTALLKEQNQKLAEAASHLLDMNNILEKLVAARTQELELANRLLESLVVTDELTGIHNRRFLEQALAQKAASISRASYPFSVIMVDLDDFKFYNDRNGHLAGDSVLRKVSKLLRQVIRGGDIITRYGGEEFCILLENTNRDAAARVAEKLRLAIRQHEFPKGKHQPLGAVTISAGVASYPQDADEVTALLDAADQALYLAKNAGRDRVECISCTYSRAAGERPVRRASSR